MSTHICIVAHFKKRKKKKKKTFTLKPKHWHFVLALESIPLTNFFDIIWTIELWQPCPGELMEAPRGSVGNRRIIFFLLQFFFFLLNYSLCVRLPWWLTGKESSYQCRRCRLDPWVGKIPWRRKW